MPKYLLPNKSLVSHSLLISRSLSIRSLLPYVSSSKGFYIILYYIISYWWCRWVGDCLQEDLAKFG
jgi:hypothetical protein